MTDPTWHPVRNAAPVEWLLQETPTTPPYAIVQRRAIRKAPKAPPDMWFRVSTWPEREVVGWCRSLEDAASAGWDWRAALGMWERRTAQRRASVQTGRADPPRRPPAPDLLREYRRARRAQVAEGTRPRHEPSTEGPF